MKNKKIQIYKDYNEDLVTSKNQDYEVKNNYKWINENIVYKIISSILYVICYLVGLIYTKLFLHIKFIGKDKIKDYKGYYLYGNHTLMVGDPFIPLILNFPKRNYTVMSSANLGIPFIGKILPFVGGLPIPKKIHEKESLFKAMEILSKKNCITIYPEGHLWPYYTKIRPFSLSSFKFPCISNVPSFSITTTYQKRKFFKRPKITIYVDGPFYPEGETLRQRATFLQENIHNTMEKRSLNSNYEYIKYKKNKENKKSN